MQDASSKETAPIDQVKNRPMARSDNLNFRNDVYCGSNKVARGRVIGGWQAREGEVPWIVALKWHNETKCGGSLIAKQWVLTAAHCLVGRDGEPHGPIRALTVGVGSTKEAKTKIYEVKSAIVHENYYGLKDFRQNDIALLYLADQVIVRTVGDSDKLRVNLICIPERGDKPKGDGYVAGWGVEEEGQEQAAERLKVTRLKVRDEEECFKNYTQEFEYMDLSEQLQFCASAPGTDACQGDR